MPAPLVYISGAELDDWGAAIEDSDGAIDMSSGWTFQVTCAELGSTTALFTKTTNITGTTTGAVVSWATTGELNSLTATSPAGSRYRLQLRCRRTSDSRDVIIEEDLLMRPAIA